MRGEKQMSQAANKTNAKVTEGVSNQIDHIERSRDQIHGYSDGIRKIFDLALSYIYYAEDAYEHGQKAIWNQARAEAPLILAAGAIPVAFTEAGRLGSPEAMSVAEDVYQIPPEICSMVKVNIGEWYLRKNKIKKILGLGSACEAYNVMFEVMKKEGYDVYTIDVSYRAPHIGEERYESLISFYKEEIRQAARWIGDGKPLDEDRLAFEIERRNRINQKLREICEYRIKHPTYMRSLPAMYTISATGHYFGRPDEYEDALDTIIGEFKALGENDYNDRVVPLAWCGGRGQEFGVYEAVDEAGGAILSFNIPTPYEVDYPDWKDDPVDSLARYMLGKHIGDNSEDRLQLLHNRITGAGCKGVLLYGTIGCTFSGIEREIWRQYFRENEFPCLSLDGSFQVGAPSGQLVTRVKAFVEMLT